MRYTVGIVTVLYNSDEVVDGFFASLAQQRDVPFRLYVIDNSPTRSTLDRCAALATRYGIDAQLIFNDANVGVARGNNQGIECALRDGCECVLLANNDTEFAASTLERLVESIQAGESAVTPKIMYFGEQRLIWYAGGVVNTWTMKTTHLGERVEDRGQFDRLRYTEYAPTCFLMLKSSLFEKVGTMDERYFCYYDDTDFVFRLRATGTKIRFLPEAVVHHKVSTSTGGEYSGFSIYYNNRNRIYFTRKNLPLMRRLVALSVIMLTRPLRAVKLRKSLQSKMWEGVRDGLRMEIPRADGGALERFDR